MKTVRGKEDLRISKYYRGDYIGLGLLKNFILTTIGYFRVGRHHCL